MKTWTNISESFEKKLLEMYFDLFRVVDVPFTNMEEVVYDLYCSQPPVGDQEALASNLGAVLSFIFIYSLWALFNKQSNS